MPLTPEEMFHALRAEKRRPAPSTPEAHHPPPTGETKMPPDNELTDWMAGIARQQEHLKYELVAAERALAPLRAALDEAQAALAAAQTALARGEAARDAALMALGAYRASHVAPVRAVLDKLPS